MRKMLKLQWIEALRSGHYTQGMGCLRNLDNTYCCLGVLADVAGAQWKKGTRPEFGFWAIFPEYDASFTASVPMALGLTFGQQQQLMHMNDKAHQSFDAIAAWIEAYIAEKEPKV